MFLYEAADNMVDATVKPWYVQAKAGKMHEKGWVARIGSSYFCVHKSTANGVCHLGATSLSSTLPAYSCSTNWQVQSLLFKAQSAPWVCTDPDLHPPFQTRVQTPEILPLLLTLPAGLIFYIFGMGCQPPLTKVFALPHTSQLHNQSEHPGNAYAELMWT